MSLKSLIPLELVLNLANSYWYTPLLVATILFCVKFGYVVMLLIILYCACLKDMSVFSLSKLISITNLQNAVSVSTGISV